MEVKSGKAVDVSERSPAEPAEQPRSHHEQTRPHPVDEPGDKRHGPRACGNEEAESPLDIGQTPVLRRMRLDHGLGEEGPGVLQIANHHHAYEGGPQTYPAIHLYFSAHNDL